MDGIVEILAEFLVQIKPPNAEEDHFYLTPQRHVIEMFGMNMIAIILYYYAMYLRKTKGEFDQSFQVNGPMKLNWFERILREGLLFCFIQQICYKYYRGNNTILYMLQPCHLNSFALFLFTYLKQTKITIMCLFVTLQYSLLTVLAIISPDLTPLTLPLEQFFFWVEHYLLLIYPIMLGLNPTVLKMGPKDRPWLFILSFSFALFVHYGVQAPVSLYSGININYMLFPPPNPVQHLLANEIYRIFFTFVVCGFIAICSFVVIPLVYMISDKLNNNARTKKKKKKI